MRHSKVLAKFLWHYPEHTYDITHWRPAGENTIQITFDDDTEMVFTYKNEDSWTLKPARKKRGKGLLGRLFN